MALTRRFPHGQPGWIVPSVRQELRQERATSRLALGCRTAPAAAVDNPRSETPTLRTKKAGESSGRRPDSSPGPLVPERQMRATRLIPSPAEFPRCCSSSPPPQNSSPPGTGKTSTLTAQSRIGGGGSTRNVAAFVLTRQSSLH